MGINKNFILPTIALTLTSQNVLAQSVEKSGLFADITASVSRDDNIYRVSDSLSQSDTYLRLSPELSAIGSIGKHRFEVAYLGDFAKYSEYDDANFNDHNISGGIFLQHSLRLSSRFEASYQKDHEDPGTLNRIQLSITEYNKYDQSSYLAGISLGSEESIGRVSFDYSRTDKDYTNNDLDYFDFVSDQVHGKFTYRIAPNTRVYAEVFYSELDYVPAPTFELDNTLKRYQAGLTWNISAKLMGDVSIGYQDRDYKLGSLQDIDGLAYDGNLEWALNTYTTLAIQARRESIDSSLDEVGGFLRNSYGLNISHELTETLKINADAGFSSDELAFALAREDERTAYRFGVEYDLLNYVSVEASYSFEERDSTENVADYKANIFALNVVVSLEK